MAGQAEIQERRRRVASLWLRGQGWLAIARELKLTGRTARRDVAAIREELHKTHVAELGQQAARSTAVLREVAVEAWAFYAKLAQNAAGTKDGYGKVANAMIGALNTVVTTEQLVAKIAGVAVGDLVAQTTVNVMGSPEWLVVRAALVRALSDYPEAGAAVSEAMQQIAAPAASAEPPQQRAG